MNITYYLITKTAIIYFKLAPQNQDMDLRNFSIIKNKIYKSSKK